MNKKISILHPGRARRRTVAAGLAVLTALSASLPAGAAAISPTQDETYYATLDYYGGLMDSSVVKSIRTFGNSTVSDYGVYDEIINLTDSREGTVSGDRVTFDLTGDVPDRFYFEGKTTRPYDQFPWTLSLSYRLNGLPVEAEKLAGEKGVVEITLDALPRSSVSEYSKNNLVLTAMSMFNGDDILSLEAPGAQVQLFGNLYCVLYAVLPGEEQHFTIRVGTEDFTYSGMVFLAVPATLQQLDQVADLREVKEETEDSYRAVLDSMHAILDSMDGMSGDLQAAASGLDQLNKARGTVSGGKDQVYDSTDAALDAAAALAQSLKPLASLPPEGEPAAEDEIQSPEGETAPDPQPAPEGQPEEPAVPSPVGHLTTALQALTETNALLNAMSSNITSLRPEVEEVQRILRNVQSDLKELKDSSKRLNSISKQLNKDLEDLQKSLDRLGAELHSSHGISSVTSPTEAISAQVKIAVTQWQAYMQATGTQISLYDFLVTVGKKSPSEAELIVKAANGELDSGMDMANGVFDSVNDKIGEVNDLIDDIAKPAGKVVDDLADLCDDLRALAGLAEDLSDGKTITPVEQMQSVTDQALRLSEHVDTALVQLDSLTGIMNTYDPPLQQAIRDTQTTVITATASLENLTAAAKSAEDLLRRSGPDLDQGTKRTLSGVSSSLRKATNGLEKTHTIRDALDTVDALITEQWDKHTGDIDNALLIDAEAAPVSLTDTRNQGTTSIQYIMRTQEIKEQEAEEEPLKPVEKDTGTIWSRIAAMFRDIWNAITGLFS